MGGTIGLSIKPGGSAREIDVSGGHQNTWPTIETFGGTGESLVKGVVVTLAAMFGLWARLALRQPNSLLSKHRVTGSTFSLESGWS
jgi:hypothetical protein